jgi:hypothetical protein
MASGRWRSPAALILAAASSALSASCGPSNGPSATPLPLAQLQSRYLAAANAYNAAEAPIAQMENTDCAAGAGLLSACKTVLGQDRQVTLTFDRAIRAIPFPTGYKASVSTLLQDDTQLEQVLQRAASGASLSADAPLFVQLSQLYSTTTQDGQALRNELGLPATSAPPTARPTPA